MEKKCFSCKKQIDEEYPCGFCGKIMCVECGISPRHYSEDIFCSEICEKKDFERTLKTIHSKYPQ